MTDFQRVTATFERQISAFVRQRKWGWKFLPPDGEKVPLFERALDAVDVVAGRFSSGKKDRSGLQPSRYASFDTLGCAQGWYGLGL
jgi:hypothetical protein